MGLISFSWDKIAVLGRICAALELWFSLMVLLVSEQDKITSGVTLHPVFYPHPPPCTAAELLDKLSVTGLLLRFARWT